MATASRPFMFGEVYINTPIPGSNLSKPLGTTGILVIGVAFLDSIFAVPPELELANQASQAPDFFDYDYGQRYDYYTGYNHQPPYHGYYGYQPSGYQGYTYPSGESSYSHLGTAGDRWSTGETSFRHKPDLVLGEARSLAEDQLTIYQQLQSSLSAVGVDGRECLLRFICEAQHRRMQRLNLLGQMLATLLTPKEDDFLESYVNAADAGRKGSCLEEYATCPVSLFSILDYANPTPKATKSKRRKGGRRSESSKDSQDESYAAGESGKESARSSRKLDDVGDVGDVEE